jgi:ABC-type lipopolysaccharide export system ATPase subunit
MGLVAADFDKIFLDREERSKFPRYKCAKVGISYLSQENSNIRPFRVWENLQCASEYLSQSKDDQKK